ncbi:MAG: AarF/ABC1/UbiB kinase family protein [Lysobacterales bacterium]|jgi:predicted unusual protein kinase regulating ubiquinone biosynthesis (AarF/ABC1/UbiB family)
MGSKDSNRKSRVPTTRIGRLVRLGFTAGELAIGGLAEGARRLARVTPDDAVNIFLTAANADKLAQRLAGMRGAAMKMGQMLSMETADILPREFADALAKLRDSANRMPRRQLRGVLGREYGKGWEARFESFDYEPVAAASIGQVHRAVTRDGRELALKIQYPGVAKSINSDVDNLAMFLKMARVLPMELDISAITAEVKRQLKEEADYLVEAHNLETYRQLVKDEQRFVVPRAHADLTTKRILAMDYVEGEPIESLGRDGVSQADRDRFGTLLQRLLFRELFEFRTMQTDPNFANYRYRAAEGRIGLLDFGSTARFSKPFTEQYARICRALIAGDEGATRRYAERIGYLRPGDSPEHAQRVLRVIHLACEPIRQKGVYDFAASNLVTRARDAGIELLFHSAGEFQAPPPETIFLHRKLVGSFLVCARIKSRVKVQEEIQRHL